MRQNRQQQQEKTPEELEAEARDKAEAEEAAKAAAEEKAAREAKAATDADAAAQAKPTEEEAAAAAAAAAAAEAAASDELALLAAEETAAMEEAEVMIDPLDEELELLNALHDATVPPGYRWVNKGGWEDGLSGGDGLHVPTWYGVTCGRVTRKLRKENPAATRGFVKRLYLDGNGLRGKIDGLSRWARLADLRILSLSHNGIEGGLPAGLAECAPTLCVLNLSCNRLTGEVPASWGEFKRLTHLWLFSNELSGPALPVEVASVTGTTSLVSLRLNRNGEGVHSAAGLCVVLFFFFLLHGCFGAVVVRGCPMKALLGCGRCCTRLAGFEGELPNGLGSLISLEELDLEDNLISGSLPPTLTKLTNLKKLHIANNEFT